MPFATAILTALGTGLSAAAGGAAATGAAAGIAGAGTVAAAGTAISTTAAGIGTALSAVGTGVNVLGSIQAGAASKQAEEIRRRQMMVTAQRERRQAIRGAMQATAATRTAGVAGNALEGSGVAGGLAQQSSDMGQKVGDINTQENFGNQMFSANAKLSEAKSLEAIGTGAASFGKSLFTSADALGRIGATWMGPRDPWNTTTRFS